MSTEKYKVLSHTILRSGDKIIFRGIRVRMNNGAIYRFNEPITAQHDPNKRVIDYIKPVIDEKLRIEE